MARFNIVSKLDVFGKFMDANGMFKKALCEYVEGLLSLYEASYLGENGEDVLSLAKEFTTTYLWKSVSQLTPKLRKSNLQALEVPRHLRMVRLETRRYIDEYGNEFDHNPVLLELAKLDYNHVQSLLQRELDEVSRRNMKEGIRTQSSIQLLMKEKNITSEEEGRKQILQLIHGLWSELNAELVTPNLVLLPIFKVALNASRTSQIVYEHDENSYLSSVENHVQYFFYKTIDM